jgi:hypothetical protein
VLIGSLLVLILVLGGVLVVVGRSTSSVPFQASWHAPLPSDPQVSGDSAELVEQFVGQYHHYFGSVGINGLPIYTVPSGQETSVLKVRTGCNDFLPGTGSRAPIPPIAKTSGTGDSPLVIYQPSSNTEWEFWQADRSGSNQWTACWGGKLTDVTGSSGIFPKPYGLAASEISYLATTVTEADVRSGRIDHTLAVDVVECSAPASAPAIHTDCSGAQGEPAEGTIFRMPRGIPVPAHLTEFGRMVFKALQAYGMVVMDHAGAVIVEAESPADWAQEGHHGTDPITASWDGRQAYQVLDGIPWKDLKVLAPTGKVAGR